LNNNKKDGYNGGSITSSPSGLSPLKYGTFRAIWLAAIVSNIGSMMQSVGESWLMTSLVVSSLIVALTWASDSLSIVALALPAGALADIVDRRRLLIISQSWMFAIAMILGLMTLLGFISPFSLIILIFLLGLGEAISTPAFSPFLLGTVPRTETRNAIILNSVALNIGRGIGPAIGGILVAVVGPSIVFILNALSFAGIVMVLLHTARQNRAAHATMSTQQLPAERISEAMRTGLRYVRNSRSIHLVFIRVIVFAISASALPALLPSLSRYALGLTATDYGILFGLFGFGAIISGIVIVPRVTNKISPDRLIVLATMLFATSLVVIGTLQNSVILGAAMIGGGVAQIMSYSSFSFVLYRSLPNWVMSRVASVYQMVLQAAIVGGSVLWGLVADHLGIKIALLLAGLVLAIGLISKIKFPLKAGNEIVDVSPSMHWPSPTVLFEPEFEQGPVLVQIEYRIDPTRHKEFAKAMRELRVIRKRDGAFFWGLFRHDKYPDVYIEAFMVESWAEHLRQHERITIADRSIEDRARSFHIGEKPPVVSHFIAEPFDTMVEDENKKSASSA
jgi:MFS family permease